MSGLQKFVVCLSVMLSLSTTCYATECFQCEGAYETPDCGANFNNNENIENNNTVSCNGSCLVTTTAFKAVSRGCLLDSSAHEGCYDQPVNGTDVFVCNHICNTDYCNGAGVIPVRKCFACDGLYDNPSCGLNFNNEAMKNGSVTECSSEKCLTTTTGNAGNGFSRVVRCCATNSTEVGCFNDTVTQPGSGTAELVTTCNSICGLDYCNGAGVIPSKKCFSCEGSYDTSTCGVNFNNTLMRNSGKTIECKGQCLATTTAFNSVKRGCKPDNYTHIGCFFEPQLVNGVTKDVFVCNYACNTDYCNGAGVIPVRKCFACDGLYDNPSCGLNFNNEAMKNGSVTECSSEKCLTTTTGNADNGFSRVVRGCATNSIEVGCFNDTVTQPGSGTAELVTTCNSICGFDYCNGAGVIPSKKCFSCEGSYDTSTCGVNFNNTLMQNSGKRIECKGQCLATTTAFNTVKRGCKPDNYTHIGCFFEPQLVNGVTKDVFVCNYACNGDYCNGAGVIPSNSKKCFSCEGSYNVSTCGVNFDNALMQNNGHTIDCKGQCLATTTAFNTVKRGCKPSNYTHIGCFFEPQFVNGVTKDVFVCNYACSSDYCNGAGVVPVRSPIKSTTRAPLVESSAHVVTFSSLIVICAVFVLGLTISDV